MRGCWPPVDRVLVIKLGALGDVVLALAAMRRIREAHPEARIDVLTTPPFGKMVGRSPYADSVQDDGRPAGLSAQLKLVGRLRREGYDRVYDLQTSSRSSALFYGLLPSPPQWSGIARGCSHPHRNPNRDDMHTLERQADQLKDAGIWPDAPTAPGTAPPPDLGWLVDSADVAAFVLPERYALLIPGGSAHRPEKRWRVERYGDLARRLAADGITPVVLGGPPERGLAQAITAVAPAALDLTGRSDFAQLASLAASAALAVGNDTGPTHLVAAAGAPTLTLFSAASDPALTAPRGPRVAHLQRDALSALSVDEVLTATALLAASS